MSANEYRAEIALFVVAICLNLAALSSPVPFVLAVPAGVMALVMFGRSLRSLIGGAR